LLHAGNVLNVVPGPLAEFVELLDVRQIVERLVGQFLRHIHTPEQAEGEDQAFPLHNLGDMPGIGLRHLRELERVLEDFEEPLGRVLPLMERRHIDNHRIAGELEQISRELAGIDRLPMKNDHVRMRMPLTRIGTPLDLERPDGALDLGQLDIRSLATKVGATSLLHSTKGRGDVAVTFAQVRAVFRGERQQRHAQAGIFRLDDLKPIQVRLHLLRPAPDRAEWAKEMLLAEGGSVEPDLAGGEIVAEEKVRAAGGELAGRLDIATLAGIIRHVERLMMCPRIAV
jgi:hypothetical protein